MIGDMTDDLSLNSSSNVTTPLSRSPFPFKFQDQYQFHHQNSAHNPTIIVAKRQMPSEIYVNDVLHTQEIHGESIVSEPSTIQTPGLLSPVLSKPIAVAIIPKRKIKGAKAPAEPKLWATDERNDISSLDETYQHALAKMLEFEIKSQDEGGLQTNRSSARPNNLNTPEHKQQMLARSLTLKSNPNSFQVIELQDGSSLNQQEQEEQRALDNENIDPIKSPQTTDPSPPSPPPAPVVEEPKRNLVESKAKNKLQNLNKFVLGHTSRKITSNWDLVENKFQSSSTHEIVIIKGENGIGNPVKYKTLLLSSLTLLLCSQQIQIKYKELVPLYEMLKYTREQINLSCKLAARKLVINSSTKPEVQQQCQQEITELLAVTPEPKVRIDLLKECVFSSDPEERKREFEQLERYRSERVAVLLEEKKRKKENLEKAETRKKKAINDFENCLQSVQYPRGPIHLKRFNHLKHIIEYCYNSLLEEYYEKTVAVDPLVIELIGPDMFPQTSSDATNKLTKASTLPDEDTLQSPTETKLAALRKAGYIRRDFPPETWKLDLIGPPTLVNVFRQTLITGKGLYGTSNTDVVELLQSYCATRISAYYRGFTRRWRYQVARRAWKHLYHFMKSKVFVAWAIETKQIRTLRHYCHRKIKAWSFFTRRATRRRYYFRVCYWPLFIWRRYAIETARAREKTKFLVGRVLPTVTLIKTFGAWKRYYLNEVSYNKPANEFYKQKLNIKLQKRLHWWVYWVRRRKGLRRGWIEKGYVMRCVKIEDCIRLPFQVWRAAVAFKVRLRDFVKKNTYKFRQFILPNNSIHLPPVKVKLSEEDRKKLLEDVTVAEVSHRTNEDSLSTKKSRKIARAKLKALRRVQTTSDVETTDRSVSTVELQAFSRQLGHTKFEWKSDLNRFDLDVAEDEMLHISPHYHELHNQFCQLHPEAFNEEHEGLNYGLKFRVIKKPTKSAIDEIKERFYEVEIWSLFDSAFCYHRMAHRVFHNLRVHAIVARNKKKIKNKYRDNLLRKVLNALFRWATRGLDDLVEDSQAVTTTTKETAGITYSKAEELAFRSRTARMEKLKKRRDAARAYKELENKQRELEAKPGLIKTDSHSEDQDDFSVDAGPRARQRRLAQEFKRINGKKNQLASTSTTLPKGSTTDSGMRRMSTRSESSLSVESGEVIPEGDEGAEDNNSVQSAENRSIFSMLSEENKSNQPTIYHSLSIDTQTTAIQSLLDQKTDMLEWDRQEREQELDLMQAMMKYGQQVKEETKRVVRQAAKETAKNTAVNDTRDEILDTIFTREALNTDKSILRELNYVSSWKIKMASKMVDTLVKIHEEVTCTLIEAEKKKYFRRLRLPLLLARSIHMCNRKKLVNWIRICKRLGILYAKAPLYRSLKLKWGFFNRWLKYYEKENLDCSGGLIKMIKKRYDQRDAFCQHLQRNNFTKTVYPRNNRLKSFGNELNSIFYRWKEFAQDSIMFDHLTNKIDEFYRLRILQKCFYCLNTKASLKLTYEERKKKFCYGYVRAFADIEQISKRYFAKRRRSLSFVIRKYQLKSQILLKKVARKLVNFKSFLHTTERDVEIRTMTEHKLMLTAFENRGTLQFQDVLVNSTMPKIVGDKFHDPKPSSSSPLESLEGKRTQSVVVPSGFNIFKIKIAIQSGLGIVGWQIYWNADCCLPIESPIRGKVVGSSITQAEFHLKQFDYLLEVEYCTEGAVIVGIRFFTYLNGWSKWIGNRGNQLSKKYRLNCSMAERDPKESVYKPSGYQEIRSPGMPWEYIIGLSGIESTVRATGLGLVVRRVTLQNIFSYHWVNESAYFTKLKHLNELQSRQIEELTLPVLGTSSSNVGAATTTTTTATTTAVAPPPRPSSPTQRRSMDLLRHLSDLQTELGFHNETDYLDVEEIPSQVLSPSEEQFFDVIRMRSVEIKAAETRALNFARYLWTNMKLRFNSELSIFSDIRILSPLVKWFLEALCKSLVQKPEDPTLISKLYTSIHYAQVELEILENRSINALSSIETTEASEKFKPWYGKVLLGPQLRSQKKAFNDHILSLKENKLAIERKIESVHLNILRLQEETDIKMPKFHLTSYLCLNFRLKINAARYKSNLLEKMTMESLKEHLGGKTLANTLINSHGGLSESEQERIKESRFKLNSQDHDFELKSLYQVTAEHEDEIRHSRNSVSELYEKTSFPFLQLRNMSTSASAMELSNPILLQNDMSMTQGRKKSFRKSVAVNPVWGNLSHTSGQGNRTGRSQSVQLRRLDSKQFLGRK